jgi:hypothetical protein
LVAATVRHEGHLRETEACSHGDESSFLEEVAQTVAQFFVGCPHPRKPWSSLELVSGLRPRLHIAERRAARKARIISTHRAVCALLGLPGRLSGLFPVRAALSASCESDLLLLLLLRRRWRWWRRLGRCSTFRQRDRRGPQVRSDPSPVAAGSLYPGTPHSAQSPQSPTEQALS